MLILERPFLSVHQVLAVHTTHWGIYSRSTNIRYEVAGRIVAALSISMPILCKPLLVRCRVHLRTWQVASRVTSPRLVAETVKPLLVACS